MPLIKVPPVAGSGSGGSGFANPAVANLDMNSYNIISSGGNSTWVVPPTGTNDHVAIEAAIDAAIAAGGGIVQLLEGTYAIGAEIEITDRFSNVTIQGVGRGTILSHGNFDGNIFNFNPAFVVAGNLNINNVTRGDTSITFTTASQAGPILAGDLISIAGLDVNSKYDAEVHVAAANGDSGTGVVTLRTPILRTMTSVVTFPTIQIRSGKNNWLKDMQFVLGTAPATQAQAIKISCWQDGGAKNLYFDNSWKDAPANTDDTIFLIWDSYNLDIENVTSEDAKNNGIYGSSIAGCLIKKARIIDAAKNSSNSDAAIRFQNCYDNKIDMPIVDGYQTDQGILFTGNYSNRRNTIVSPTILGSKYRGIDFGVNGLDNCVLGGAISSVTPQGDSYGIYIRDDGNKVIGVDLNNCNYPIYAEAGERNIISGCTLRDWLNYGITLTSSSHLNIIQGNTFLNSTANACIYNDSDDSVIVGNLFDGASGKAIVFGDTAENNKVAFNNVRNTTGYTQGAGTGNVFIDNFPQMVRNTYETTVGWSSTSSSYVDITGMAAENFVIDKSGTYEIVLDVSSLWCTGGDSVAQICADIDGSDFEFSRFFVPGGGEYFAVTKRIKATLTAGTLAIKPQIKKVAGAGTLQFDSGTGDVLEQITITITGPVV